MRCGAYVRERTEFPPHWANNGAIVSQRGNRSLQRVGRHSKS